MLHGSFSKNFWKFCKPFFTNQITNSDDKIMLVENEKVVSKNEEIACHFNTFSSDITNGSNIEKWPISNLLCKDPLAYLKSNQSLGQ